jgi:DNA-binding CsgD family transcriptional regulator
MEAESQQCTVVCWPIAEQMVALSYVTREGWPFIVEQAPRGLANGGWRQTVAFGMMRDLLGRLDFADVPLGRRLGEDRLAVFARQHGFTAEDLWLLSVCASPLAAIDQHALHVEARTSRPARDGSGDSVVEPPTTSLTKREVEVLTLLHLGLKARTMAARLGVSQFTVNKHLGNVYRKLEAHDRLVAVSKAQAMGILPRGL